MVDIETFKNSLGDMSKHLSEREIEKLLQLQYRLANVLFDLWQLKGKGGVVSGAVVVTHEKNGQCVSAFGFGFIYAYA